MDNIIEEDHPFMLKTWQEMTTLKKQQSFELRFNKKWYHRDKDEWKNIHVLIKAFPRLNEDGSLKCLMGSFTDISLFKQAEDDALERAHLSEQLAERTKEALESELKFLKMAELAPCGTGHPLKLLSRICFLILTRNVSHKPEW